MIVCIVLLNGCTPKLSIDLFNFTGEKIVVLESGHPILISAGEHKRIAFFGSEHNDGAELLGPVIQAGARSWFYPVSTHQESLLNPPASYWRQIGSDRGLYVALDKDGSFYLLSSKSQDLASARAFQPIGFPLKPRLIKLSK